MKDLTRKIGKSHVEDLKKNFRSYISMYRASSQKNASVELYQNVLKGVLLEATDTSCGWTKSPAGYNEIYVEVDDDVSNNISNTSKEMYLEAKKKARSAVYFASF